MDIPETERELFSYLSSLTREVGSTPLDRFTTAGLSAALSLSRNLTSHYLNDLTRLGVVVKAGMRPVYYFGKKDLERHLQAQLGANAFASVDELLAARSEDGRRDFDLLVGSDLSLAPVVEKLKGAVKYPPNGLPVMLCGAPGTGRSRLVAAMCEFGRWMGVLPKDAGVTVVDCGCFAGDAGGLAAALCGSGPGEAAPAATGIIVLKDVDRLETGPMEYVTGLVTGQVSDAPRLVLTSTCDVADKRIARLVRTVPVVVNVPALRDRSLEEREELVLDLLKGEGRRLGADVLISRKAFSCLVNADFENNISGLRACIISCCSAANLARAGDRLEIQACMLPGPVLAAVDVSSSGESELIDTTRALERAGDALSVRVFRGMLDSYHAFVSGGISQRDLERDVVDRARDYEDHLAFEDSVAASRGAVFERVVGDLAVDVGTTYGVKLSRKATAVIARCILAHSQAGTRIAKWEESNKAELTALFATLAAASRTCRLATESLVASVETTLGVRLGVASRVFVFVTIFAARREAGRRESAGIILSHGYSTATSIADAANRILHAHVFEAIDMSYDQQVSDIVEPLRELLDTYSFCKEIAVLVDMGSLENAIGDVGRLSNVTVGVVNNASTGLALEIGSGLLAGEPLSELLPEATAVCASRYRIVEARNVEQAVAFCSEGGAQAAERIRNLVEQSLEVRVPLRFIAGSPAELRQEAEAGRYDLIAVIGTDGPGIEGVPFIALEDLISGDAGAGVDGVFSRFLEEDDLVRFHQNLVKNLTLRNVIESITILNPSRVLDEVEQAVETLQELIGGSLRAHTMIGLCVHLCCLIERLITHSAIESYAGAESFEEEHGDFARAFRKSFAKIAGRYGVDVPMAEIAYAYDYINND